MTHLPTPYVPDSADIDAADDAVFNAARATRWFTPAELETAARYGYRTGDSFRRLVCERLGGYAFRMGPDAWSPVATRLMAEWEALEAVDLEAAALRDEVAEGAVF